MDKFLKDRMSLIKTIKNIVRSEKTIEDIKKDHELIECKNCHGQYTNKKIKENYYVCPSCQEHYYIGAYERIEITCDEGSFKEINKGIKGVDPLRFPEYRKKIKEAKKKSGLNEAVVTGTCKIKGIKAFICVMDNRFMMASMGMAVGEKITKAIEYAEKKKLPLIIFSTSGGARMQEGIISLMQMAKTSAALANFSQSGNLFISVLTHPTTGGVTASFASLGDIQIGERGALIGFAGPRVISQTIGEQLPEDFQKAEFLKEKGFLDMVVDRSELRDLLGDILELHINNCQLRTSVKLEDNLNHRQDMLKAYERVELARRPNRLTTKDYIDNLIDDFIELSGDRLFGDDKSIIGGIGKFNGVPVTVIGHRKGKSLDDNLLCRFGMPNPEGYRKAKRLMLQAEKFNRPIITFVDTPGAYPGKEAEERGQGSAIAECLFTLANLQVPVINVFVGEGGSGGALAIGFGDSMIMLENSIFSILSPEGFASILWKDSKLWKEACEDMKLTSYNMKKLGICDFVVREYGDGNIGTAKTCKALENIIAHQLESLMKVKKKDLVKARYKRLKDMGKDLV